MENLKHILIKRLEDKGIQKDVIPSFFRTLACSCHENPEVSLSQINTRLEYLGWNNVELDYYTFQLVINCVELYDFKLKSYKTWFSRLD